MILLHTKEDLQHIHNQVLLPLLRLFAYVLEIDEEYFVNRHRYDAEGLEYLRYMVYHPRTAEEDANLNNIWARGHTVCYRTSNSNARAGTNKQKLRTTTHSPFSFTSQLQASRSTPRMDGNMSAQIRNQSSSMSLTRSNSSAADI